jgi:hypothetical protein
VLTPRRIRLTRATHLTSPHPVPHTRPRPDLTTPPVGRPRPRRCHTQTSPTLLDHVNAGGATPAASQSVRPTPVPHLQRRQLASSMPWPTHVLLRVPTPALPCARRCSTSVTVPEPSCPSSSTVHVGAPPPPSGPAAPPQYPGHCQRQRTHNCSSPSSHSYHRYSSP